MKRDLERFLLHQGLLCSTATVGRMGRQLRPYIRHLSRCGVPYRTATKKHVEQYLRSVCRTAQSRQSICATVRRFYSFLQTENNPACAIHFKADTSRRLPHVPGKEAIERIIADVSEGDTELSLRNALMLELAYGSGLRRDELRRVNIEDVDPEQQTIRVPGKGGRERIVPLTGAAVDLIRRYLSRRNVQLGPLLATAAGRRMSGGAVYWILKIRHGIKPHLLRHACATHMLQNGCSIRYIQQLLGHQRLTTTHAYTHITREGLRQVLHRCHPAANP